MNIAYYGTNLDNLDKVLKKYNLKKGDSINTEICAEIVSRLKYPEPVSNKEKRLRGFNQSDFISTYFSTRFSIPQIKGVERIKNTKPQASLPGKEERRINIQNAFAIKKSIFCEKTIILVDDVFTSGSTLNEIAKLIKKHHARRVFAFTLAHGSFRK